MFKKVTAIVAMATAISLYAHEPEKIVPERIKALLPYGASEEYREVPKVGLYSHLYKSFDMDGIKDFDVNRLRGFDGYIEPMVRSFLKHDVSRLEDKAELRGAIARFLERERINPIEYNRKVVPISVYIERHHPRLTHEIYEEMRRLGYYTRSSDGRHEAMNAFVKYVGATHHWRFGIPAATSERKELIRKYLEPRSATRELYREPAGEMSKRLWAEPVDGIYLQKLLRDYKEREGKKDILDLDP